MKKLLFSLLIVATLLSPFSVKAEMTNEEITAQIKAQIEALELQLKIQILLDQIALLQSQISQMQTNQQSMQSTINELQSNQPEQITPQSSTNSTSYPSIDESKTPIIIKCRTCAAVPI